MKISTFAQRLRAGLDARQMTQAELSSRSKISKSSISHYLKGDWEGKQDAVYSIAQVLNVSEAWLMGYDVPMDAEHATPSQPAQKATIPPGFEPMPGDGHGPIGGPDRLRYADHGGTERGAHSLCAVQVALHLYTDLQGRQHGTTDP